MNVPDIVTLIFAAILTIVSIKVEGWYFMPSNIKRIFHRRNSK